MEGLTVGLVELGEWFRWRRRAECVAATRLRVQRSAQRCHRASAPPTSERTCTFLQLQVYRENVTGSVAMDFGGVAFTNAYNSLTNIVVTITPAGTAGRPGLLIAAHHDSAVASPGACAGRRGSVAPAQLAAQHRSHPRTHPQLRPAPPRHPQHLPLLSSST